MKKTYIKITYEGGDFCVVKPEDVPDMTEGECNFTTEEIQMTEDEFLSLPEFQG